MHHAYTQRTHLPFGKRWADKNVGKTVKGKEKELGDRLLKTEMRRDKDNKTVVQFKSM